jgi:hypothetical protein
VVHSRHAQPCRAVKVAALTNTSESQARATAGSDLHQGWDWICHGQRDQNLCIAVPGRSPLEVGGNGVGEGKAALRTQNVSQMQPLRTHVITQINSSHRGTRKHWQHASQTTAKHGSLQEDVCVFVGRRVTQRQLQGRSATPQRRSTPSGSSWPRSAARCRLNPPPMPHHVHNPHPLILQKHRYTAPHSPLHLPPMVGPMHLALVHLSRVETARAQRQQPRKRLQVHP